MSLLGCESPRLFTPPLRELTPQTSAGFAAIAFAEEILRLTLLPWQKWLLIHMLELRPDGRMRFRYVLVLVARQNGKSTISQVLALFWLFVEQVGLVIGTAQSLDIAEEVWSLSVELAQATPELAEEIDGEPVMAAGKKALVLTGGRRYKVVSANRRGGRSLSADRVLLDELREHTKWDAWGAITKTTMARPDSMVVGLSNAGDDSSVVLNYEREIGLSTLAGDGPDDFGLFEWSAPDGCDKNDRGAWAQANPSLGHLIDEESIASAVVSDPEVIFRTEVLCQKVDSLTPDFMPLWPSRADGAAKMPRGAPLAFGVDVSWDRSTSWIGAAVTRPDGRIHVELVDTREGTDWVIDRLAELRAKWQPVGVFFQANGAPVSSLGIDGDAMAAADLAKASGAFFDAVGKGRIVHIGQEPLNDAAAGASIKPFGDAWLLDRRKSTADVAPLNACLQAMWGLTTTPPPKKPAAIRRIR